MLLCFSRDTAVLEHFKYNSATPPKSYIQGETSSHKPARAATHTRCTWDECFCLCVPQGKWRMRSVSLSILPMVSRPPHIYTISFYIYGWMTSDLILTWLFEQVSSPSTASPCTVSTLRTTALLALLSRVVVNNRKCVCLPPAVAPLCFLYNEPSTLYSVFREMYIRHFFRLHSISSSPSVSARPVCLLLLHCSVRVYVHFLQLHVCPCRV